MNVADVLRGRGTAIAFLDVLFSCIGMFITVIALQSAAAQRTPPPIGAHAYFGVLADGSVLQATAEGVHRPADIEAAIKSVLAATAYPRVDVLFSGEGIARKADLEEVLAAIVAGLKPARLIETNWRPAPSEDGIAKELERIAKALGASKGK
jgi:hypothetical protein